MKVEIFINDKKVEVSNEDITTIVSTVNKYVSPMDRIKSIEDVLEYHGLDNQKFVRIYGSMEKRFQTLKLLELVISALNDGWKPDFNNQTQPKYYPWFKYNDNGSFVFYDCDYCCWFMGVPSALLLKSEELALYAKDVFFELYKEYYTTL